jgi:tRNA-dihydrouridine synthase 3
MLDLINKAILAPLTKGGNLPFRRLCVDFGADVTVSEMAYARFVAKGDKRERALIRKHPSEKIFGVQLAVIDHQEGVAAGQIAIDNGADFIDINCGCPIEDTTRRGLGASVLRKPQRLSELVAQMTKKLSVPVSVKIRLGWSEGTQNYLEIAKLMQEAGAFAVTVHGRTKEQHYNKAANWEAIKQVKDTINIPVIGNGDILTHYEFNNRKQFSNVDSIMIGRGALIKPWIFEEIKSNSTKNLSPEELVAIYYRLSVYMKEHFRDDEKGIKRILNFLPWHFSFFHRYQYLPFEHYGAQSCEHPLIQSRLEHLPDSQFDTDPLLRVLRSSDPAIHAQIANILLHVPENTIISELRKIPINIEPNSQISTTYAL